MHILLIEDDVNAASYVIKGLKESGYVVDHAQDGEKGMEFAISLKFDVMVIDRMLPKIDGLSLICLLYTSPSPRDLSTSRMPSSA